MPDSGLRPTSTAGSRFFTEPIVTVITYSSVIGSITLGGKEAVAYAYASYRARSL